MNNTHTRHRRLAAACEEADKMVVADAKFFARFPSRTHRVRLASRAEMEANAAAVGLAEVPLTLGLRWYCAVKQIASGVRSRVFLQNDPSVDTELSEWQAEYVYNLVAKPGSKTLAIEQSIRGPLAKRGAA